MGIDLYLHRSALAGVRIGARGRDGVRFARCGGRASGLVAGGQTRLKLASLKPPNKKIGVRLNSAMHFVFRVFPELEFTLKGSFLVLELASVRSLFYGGISCGGQAHNVE